jgi:hypothetical protein
MPFILIIIGVILLVTAIQGTTTNLGHMLAGDIFGSQGYLYWFLAIISIGAVGYIKPLKPASDAFLVLLLLVLFLANGGVFAKIGPAIAAIKPSSNTTSANGTTSTPATGGLQSLTSTGQSNSTGQLGSGANSLGSSGVGGASNQNFVDSGTFDNGSAIDGGTF